MQLMVFAMYLQDPSQHEETDQTAEHEPSLHERAGARWRDRKVVRLAMMFSLFMIALILLYIVGAVLMKSVSLQALQNVRQSLLEASVWFGFVRWAFIALLIFYWEPINHALARRNHWSEHRLQRVLSGRWATLGVLVLVEVVFMQRLLEPLIDGVGR